MNPRSLAEPVARDARRVMDPSLSADRVRAHIQAGRG